MTVFALITNNKVGNIIVAELRWLDLAHDLTYDIHVDITNMSPQPGVGWDYDPLHGTFSDNRFTPMTTTEIVDAAIAAAKAFGGDLADQFARENVLLGITQAGQTIPVSKYCHDLWHYMTTGSLYAAETQLNTMINDVGLEKLALAPFVTNTRLTAYLGYIQAYLSNPSTTSR